MRRLIHSLSFLDENGGNIQNGYLITNSDRIEELTAGVCPQDMSLFDEVINGTNRLLLPGFINTHGHAAMSLLRGFADDLPLQSWLSDLIWPAEDLLTPDDIYLGTQLSMLEMIETGTTTFTDMYFHMDRVADAVIESGMRASLGRGLVSLGDGGEKSLSESEAFIRDYHLAGDGRIHTNLAPHAPYTCPGDYLKKVIKAADKWKVPIQIHVSESKSEVGDSFKQYGVSPVKWLADLGLFEYPTIAAHCVHVSSEDIDLLQQHHVHVAHNPGSNLKLGSGIAPLLPMLKAGIQVGIGTDGASSNNKLDMFEELRLVALIHKGNNLEATAIDAHTALDLVTQQGARTLFLDGSLGQLVPGSPADFQLIDISGPRYYPRHNLLSHAVYSSYGGDVTDVYVAGKPLMRNRDHLTLDKEKILYDVSQTAKKFQPIKERYESQNNR